MAYSSWLIVEYKSLHFLGMPQPHLCGCSANCCGFFMGVYFTMEKQIRDIGQQLSSLRKAAGYSSYADFAWAHDLDKTQYGRMERGVNCTFKTLLKVLEIHDLSLQGFFSLMSESKPTSTQKTP